MPNPSSRIRHALEEIRNIAQEIVDVAADPARKVSELFTEAAIQKKISACLELAHAVADCNRLKWLCEAHADIENTANLVVAADNALSPYITLNPEAMTHALSAELKVFDMLLSANPFVLILAKAARRLEPWLIGFLHMEFVSARIQILQHENGGAAESGERIIKTIKAEHEQTRRQITKAINTRNIDGLDIVGPRTQECRGQVLSVVMWLANPKHPQSIYHSCKMTFQPVEGGYDDEERLYLWCHRNESRIWAWVETYRLNHNIG